MARCSFVNSFILQVLTYLTLINEASPYEKLFLESRKLCSLRDEPTVVNLGERESSAKLALETKYFERWSGKYKFFCSFIVRAPPNHGVYATIQSLSLRKNTTSGWCRDFVEFEIPQSFIKQLFKKADKVEKKFCGRIAPSESHLSGVKDINYTNALSYASVAENGFVAKDGLLQVNIHVAKEKLEINDELDIKIVFTAYKYDCNRREESFQCKECEWIWEGLYLDKIQNCPYNTCLDENYCAYVDTKIRNTVSSGTGTKVSIGAVATIILVLLMFACCVWMSRRLQLFCFNPSRNRQSRMEMDATQRNSRLNDTLTPYGGVLPEDTTPSAPIAEDKDLPPSYSSLFPGK